MAAKRKSPSANALTPEQQEAVARAQKAANLAALEHQQRVLKRLIAAKKSKISLLDYTRFTMPHPEDIEDTERSLYETNWHHRAIAELLEKVERGEILRAVIEMPPRMGKSELVSRRFPSWFMGRDPYRQVIFTTYAQDFADDFGRKTRETIQLPQYQQVFPGVELQKSSKAANRMETTAGGMVVFVGVGGPVTGRGADLLLLDDPFKNREEAESVAHRDMVWNWFTSTAYTRLMPNGRIVIVLTRWHEDDIVGRIFNPDFVPPEESAKWYRLSLPAIIDEGGSEERALWPERYPLEVLKSTRAFIGARDWSALYQQKPTPPEGVFFKREMIRTYRRDEMPKNFRSYMTGDLALGESTKNDKTCVGPWMLDEHDNLFLHPEIFWDRRKADQSVEKIIDMMEQHRPMQTWWEKGQIDKAVGPFLNKRIAERGAESGFYGYVDALPVKGDKGARATAIRGRMAQGKVFFPVFAPWWPQALDQMLKFTGSGDDAEDDFVDMCSLIGQALGSQVRAGKVVEREGNVYKVGTLAWIKYDSDYRKREQKRLEAQGGF